MSNQSNPIIRNVANGVTCLNLTCGILAIVAALQGSNPYWGLTGLQWAWILVGGAALFDFADGAVARLLHTTSAIGKELDSLCDVVSFGAAPALMVFTVMTENSAGWPAYLALLIAVLGAVRLARFNIDTRQTTSFIGLPIPASAIFWIGVTAWIGLHRYPGNAIMLIMIVVMSLLMVSSLKLFSLKFKSFGWRENFRRYVIILAAILFVVTDGIPGFAWTILLYILISAVGRKDFV